MSIGGCTGRKGVQPPPPPQRCQLQPPRKKIQPPRKIQTPLRLREYSHEKEVLMVSQSINATDFIQQQKLGLCPKLILKLLIRLQKYGSNYCTSTQLYLNNGFMMQVDHGSFRSAS